MWTSFGSVFVHQTWRNGLHHRGHRHRRAHRCMTPRKLRHFCKAIADVYRMKDLGSAQTLSYTVANNDANNRVLAVDEKCFVDALLEEYGPSECNPSRTPGETAHDIYVKGGNEARLLVLQISYQSGLWTLWLDASVAERGLAHYYGYPNRKRMAKCKQILRFLSRTEEPGLCAQRSTEGHPCVRTGYANCRFTSWMHVGSSWHSGRL